MPMPDYSRIRPDILESLKRYRDQGVETGGFLRAVLENDLREAFGRADEYNVNTLFHIAAWCYNELPGNCWGSPQQVEGWLELWELKRLQQRQLQQEIERMAAKPEGEI